jgi:hypothetical protein
MTSREAIAQILEHLPEDRVSQLLDYARHLSSTAEASAWQEWGRRQLAKAYHDDEPEYTEADLLRGPRA